MTHRMTFPSKALLLWVSSVKKHQQLARNRSVSSVEIVLVDLIDKGWNEKTLNHKVKAQFPEECKCTEFEFVKIVSGVLVKPIFASGVRANRNILLKSIVCTGVVYLRLLVEDDPDEDSGFVRVMENLESHGILQFHFPDLESPEI